MNLRSSGGRETSTAIESWLNPFADKLAWICQPNGQFVAGSPPCQKIHREDLDIGLSKHRAQIDKLNLGAEQVYLDLRLGLNHPINGLFSCRKIQQHNQSYFLIVKVNPQNDLRITRDQLIAEEFGIYAWHYHLESGRFFFSPEGSKKFFRRLDPQLEYSDFYSALAPESLQKFSEAMEAAINFRTSFRLELMLDKAPHYQWISFSCHVTEDGSNSPWLTGLIRDLESDRTENQRKQQLEQWLQMGVAKMEIKNFDGEVLAAWGSGLKSSHIVVEGNRRKATIFDFRNRPKFEITTDIGENTSSQPLPKTAPASLEKPVQTASAPELKPEQDLVPALPIDRLNKDEKCVALTQWLGQSLDVQVSALGIFDGSRFEWKAWWKSPNRFALPVRKYKGEWLPELDWLVEVESDNQKYTERHWWPQDLLPFQISESFGEGWMILAEPISQKETTVFAIKTSDPEAIKEKTQHVLKSLDLLKDAPVLPSPDTIDNLKAELAKKDMLIREMNHRAKNNLALAASLVKMEAGYSEDDQASKVLRQTQKRLETLASIHELMYMSQDTKGSVNMKDYLGQIAKGLVLSFGNPELKLELHIDPVFLDMKTANTIGLLVNELISNSFKHAFRKDTPGLLKVDFLDKEGFYKLRVSDNGPGLQPGHQSTNSLGHLLIDEFVKQLQGSMEIISSPGTTYLISIKKSIIDA
jgi:two-component sensor histidine kinase